MQKCSVRGSINSLQGHNVTMNPPGRPSPTKGARFEQRLLWDVALALLPSLLLIGWLLWQRPEPRTGLWMAVGFAALVTLGLVSRLRERDRKSVV